MFNKIKRILYRSFDSREISYKELEKMINKDQDVVLVDVRSSQEFNEGHLYGAINIPLYDLDKNIDRLPEKSKTIITYCASGHRSRQAKEELETLGYENVYNLKNGLEGI